MRDEIQRLLEQDPFRAFRIVLSSGHVYEVHNPGMFYLMQDVALFAAARSDLYSYLRLVQIAAVDIIV